MFVNPSKAFVEKPSLVASSSGSAKNARYARLLPSTRKSSDSRAGASSSWSSAPVSDFGDTHPSLCASLEHSPPVGDERRELPAVGAELVEQFDVVGEFDDPVLPTAAPAA